jgi:hypothetical protein
MSERSESSDHHYRSANGWWVVVLLILILAVVTSIRIRLLNMPLERDEGEYAYAGQLLFQGIPPYEGIYNMKWPGTYVAYAIIMAVFGQTPGGIHVGLILVNLATAALVFLLARRIYGNAAGVVAAGTYVMLSITPATCGLAAHATHFVMLPAIAGILLLQSLEDNTSLVRVFSAGLLLGLAVLMKQSGAAFGLFAAVWVTWGELSSGNRVWRRLFTRLGCLALGGFLPMILTCLILAVFGVFDRFWLYAFKYAWFYASVFPATEGARALCESTGNLFNAAPVLWSMAGLGLALLFCERSLAHWRFFIVSLSFFSFLAVCPGLYFRGHYFIQLLPAGALLTAAAFHVFSVYLRRTQTSVSSAVIPSVIFVVAVADALNQQAAIYFLLTPTQACRAIYNANPFPEAVEVGRYLASRCTPDARIAVIGSEPEIFFYSHRHSATGYIYTYPLMEPQPYALTMQKEMIREIEAARPDYVIFVHVSSSMSMWPVSTNALNFVDWFDKYQRAQLQQVGTVEIRSADETEYRWFSPQDTVVMPSSDYWLTVFRRRSAGEQTPPLKVHHQGTK